MLVRVGNKCPFSCSSNPSNFHRITGITGHHTCQRMFTSEFTKCTTFKTKGRIDKSVYCNSLRTVDCDSTDVWKQNPFLKPSWMESYFLSSVLWMQFCNLQPGGNNRSAAKGGGGVDPLVGKFGANQGDLSWCQPHIIPQPQPLQLTQQYLTGRCFAMHQRCCTGCQWQQPIKLSQIN